MVLSTDAPGYGGAGEAGDWMPRLHLPARSAVLLRAVAP